MKFVILTGMSGAGKSTAIKMMEDIGFYCVDNLPIPLLEKFVELTTLQSAELQKVAVGIDIRSGQSFDELHGVLDHMKDNGVEYEILFLDAEDSVLVKRYKETRRNHPLAGGERVDKGIEEERKRLAFLKERADYIIDTSQLLTRELKAELDKIFIQNQDYKNLFITILSFGFKYGIPVDSDPVSYTHLDVYKRQGLYYQNKEIPIDRTSEGFKLITRIQDEAHRFAIEYHRSLRSKEQVHSVLDDIPGIGSARRKALMRRFQSLEAIREASEEELAKTESMNEQAARAVYSFFREDKHGYSS